MNLRPLLSALEKNTKAWILEESPIYENTVKPVEFDGKSYPFAEYFKQKKIDPKVHFRYSKYYSRERHTIAGSYVWADKNLSEFADELEKPIHSGKLCWIDVLITCQYEIENSRKVVGLTGKVYSNCEILILLSSKIFTRAWCLLEAANYTRKGCKIFVVGQCSFLHGEDYFASMDAGVKLDVALIKDEIDHMFGADFEYKFNRAIDDAVVHLYGESLLYNGRFQEAVPVFVKELEVKRRRGDDESSIADTYNQLGRASESLGNYAESLEYHNEALTRRVQCYGTGHVSVAISYKNMGIVEMNLGNLEKALDLYQKALDIEIKSLGGAHVSVAATETNIGNVLYRKGDYENALLRYQKALEIETKSLGEAHVNVAVTYVCIANVHRCQIPESGCILMEARF